MKDSGQNISHFLLLSKTETRLGSMKKKSFFAFFLTLSPGASEARTLKVMKAAAAQAANPLRRRYEPGPLDVKRSRLFYQENAHLCFRPIYFLVNIIFIICLSCC
ncbi:MAG: hypothetical protein MUP09_10480 [Thiovulaceae bacterium]|nr:hypothetical protein [Sulfurimonadaceae bacterium]